MLPINHGDFHNFPSSPKSDETVTCRVPGGNALPALLSQDEPEQHDESHNAASVAVHFAGGVGWGGFDFSEAAGDGGGGGCQGG